MSDFAIIATGGKQYRVAVGDLVKVEKIVGEQGATASFDVVLLRQKGDSVEVGSPHVASAVVAGTIVRQARDRKKLIFKYHSKARYHKTKGHRQEFTEVKITSI